MGYTLDSVGTRFRDTRGNGVGSQYSAEIRTAASNGRPSDSTLYSLQAQEPPAVA